MKIYWTRFEGAEWDYFYISRKDLCDMFKRLPLFKHPNFTGALCINNTIYDFQLLRLKNQPWIRKLDPQQSEFLKRKFC